MAEYINRDRFIHHLEMCIVTTGDTNGYTKDFETCLKALKNQPTADVAEVRHGKWKLFSSDKIGNVFICSICGNIEVTENFETTPLDNDCNYCSKCGAKMDKERE